MLLEDWIDTWVTMLGDIEPTTVAKYKYFVEGHILPQLQGRQLGSLTFEENRHQLRPVMQKAQKP
jgi:hypothetical protein